ncbi:MULTISPECIES: hypothetical protein [Streptomyces]|uniref:DNA-directed RNA polymerase specialized sigma24 family protein n=1 Tax=Streptomyces albus (strain ATCC 21838 / DSM 41398 / FERM P-419 / JCM 4703 / NBRC 107858) TaxID=1081613 RepID=A0A0B5ET76_STRA4|nr:hypothetical protein [Streptomyces sp. SCSIO ZS0520]AJE86033.1 hypothetical protein SLNWT_5657 [Streptomyces albus]AOU80335.1 hypothetical protein SLNHY_5644 [Streptomyces albus]AYN36046.1 hypothetical protein DUI70_5551 [Streptomyces albus]
MQSQDVAPRQEAAAVGQPVDVEQAQAALVEHYPRLVRLAYLVLPPGLGRGRRVLLAHGLAQRALPRGRGREGAARQDRVPDQRGPKGADPGYAFVRLRVLRTALRAAAPRRRLAPPRQLRTLPLVWGLRLFPRSGGPEEIALDQQLAQLSGPARAAFALRGLEELSEAEAAGLLAAAGAEEPGRALAEAARVTVPGVRGAAAVLGSPGFDPCSLQARPTDVLRRRQHLKAVLAGAAALLACGALLGLPGEGWGPDGPAAPPYAKNPAAEAALDPARLLRAAPGEWRTSSREDFSVWPARGGLRADQGLLRRALAVWARPGGSVRVSATPGTPSGAPPGPPRLLFAAEVDGARVVLFHDGLRIVRYAEPADGSGGAALDFAAVGGAEGGTALAVVAGRSDGNVRYLTAPWADRVRVRDLRTPEAAPTVLPRSAEGVTDPVPQGAATRDCGSWNALQVRDRASGADRLLTDLGELTPARLTYGPPGGPAAADDDPEALNSWAAGACSLTEARSHGVRTVNSWRYAAQQLPEAGGTARWLCARAETWRGTGSRTFAQFWAPGRESVAVTAKAEDAAACGPRRPRVLAGVLWKSEAGNWYLLAAGSADVTSVRAAGGVTGRGAGNLLALPASQGARAKITGRLADGSSLAPLK